MPINIASPRALLALFLLAASSFPAAQAAVRLPAFYSDNMLFQRGQPMVLRGWADAGETLSASDGRTPVVTTADATGRWRLELPPREAAEGLTLRISGRAQVLALQNVAVGELWFASGQSNMGWPMNFMISRVADIQAARFPGVRIANVQQRPSRLPEEDARADWYAASPETVREFSAVAYHFARSLHQALGVPVGVIQASWGGTRIEPWMPPEDLARAAPQLSGQRNPHNHMAVGASLYHGMVAPFGDLRIRGILWYQGESNLPDGRAYLPKQNGLIEGWRRSWRAPALPFLLAQVAPMDYSVITNDRRPDLVPRFWEVQSDVLQTPATGLITTLDLNPAGALHPEQKREVGERFSALALQQVYGRATASGARPPMFAGHRAEGASLRVQWSDATGLRTRDGRAPRGFELAGSDGRFVPAQARIEGTTVVVTAPGLSEPRAVRYAWSAVPDATLVNAAGLPAYPFRHPRSD